jgi:hypothetical protein
MINKKAFALAGAVIGLGGLLFLFDRAQSRLRDQVIDDSLAGGDPGLDFEFDLNELDELPEVATNAQRFDRGNTPGTRNRIAPLNGNRNPINNKNGYFNRGSR